ncbi:uncharacterized protein A4U43_C04F2910 [Asparagus officinalis]|uniref:Dilute domain-containing protein n=2 Tax=Asparagus officinalis TaxID=4686 RepID=A0A5P1EZL3_ASPOF|nr:uncharacterized protein A4U43_C04F2910 [Asparagus officinalis]
MSEHLSIETTPTKNLDNGHYDAEEPKAPIEPQSAPPALKNYANSDPKLRRSFIERQHESVDALINCVVQNLGFSEGKPVAAFTIYRCLLHWKSFESEKTNVFDRLIQMIGSAIENEESNDHLAYWISNVSTLLVLLQKSLNASGTVQRRKPPPPTSFFGRMAQGFRSSANLAFDGLDVVRQVEAKYPALLFKQQLTAYVEKMYGIIRDNVKKDITSLLSLCIQAPRTARASMLRGSNRSFGNSTQSSHWQSIIESLNNLLKTLQENYVPEVLIQKIFSQIFSFINVQLFNSLLLRRECCSFSNGEYVKSGLAELELWCAQAKPEYAGSSWEELKHIRQAVGFLVIFQKYRISYDEIVNDLCPVLSVQQLYRICTQYWDDKYNTQSVSSSVLSSMRILMTEDSNSAASSAFLLDDNSSIPFSVDDISSSLQDKNFSDVKHPEELLENPAFQFLQD